MSPIDRHSHECRALHMEFDNVVVYACAPQCPLRVAKELSGNRLAIEQGWVVISKAEISEWSDE
jgi:hypothetical protein